MNILYITPKQYYSRKHAGGMGTKTASLQAAWSKYHVIDVKSQVEASELEFYDAVIIELLGFRNRNFEEKIKLLKASKIPVFVYGSDSEIFRWSGKALDALSDIVTLWIPNCPWQANYFRDFDLPVSDVVYEPIDCEMFRPSDKRKQAIFAGGAISFEKQSEFFIELFQAINDFKKDYQTEYLGSAGLWGDYKALNLELEHELKQKVDIFHGSVPQNKVANTLGSAGIVVLNPKYETCNRFYMEALASGVPVVCGPHVCYDDRLTTERFNGNVDDCLNTLSELTDNFTSLPDNKFGAEAREYAVEHWSYEASCEQLNAILQEVL